MSTALNVPILEMEKDKTLNPYCLPFHKCTLGLLSVPNCTRHTDTSFRSPSVTVFCILHIYVLQFHFEHNESQQIKRLKGSPSKKRTFVCQWYNRGEHIVLKGVAKDI